MYHLKTANGYETDFDEFTWENACISAEEWIINGDAGDVETRQLLQYTLTDVSTGHSEIKFVQIG